MTLWKRIRQHWQDIRETRRNDNSSNNNSNDDNVATVNIDGVEFEIELHDLDNWQSSRHHHRGELLARRYERWQERYNEQHDHVWDEVLPVGDVGVGVSVIEPEVVVLLANPEGERVL